MTTILIAWGDGTADNILVTFTGAPNKTLRQRQRVIKLKSTDGVMLETLAVTQKARTRAFKLSYTNSYK